MSSSARARRHAVVVCRYRCRLADGFVSGAGRTGEGGWRGACRTTTSTTTTTATTAKRLAPWEGTHRAASAGWSVTDGVGCACCVKTSPTSDLARLPFFRHQLVSPTQTLDSPAPLEREDDSGDRHVLQIVRRAFFLRLLPWVVFFLFIYLFLFSLTPEPAGTSPPALIASASLLRNLSFATSGEWRVRSSARAGRARSSTRWLAGADAQ